MPAGRRRLAGAPPTATWSTGLSTRLRPAEGRGNVDKGVRHMASSLSCPPRRDRTSPAIYSAWVRRWYRGTGQRSNRPCRRRIEADRFLSPVGLFVSTTRLSCARSPVHREPSARRLAVSGTARVSRGPTGDAAPHRGLLLSVGDTQIKQFADSLMTLAAQACAQEALRFTSLMVDGPSRNSMI